MPRALVEVTVSRNSERRAAYFQFHAAGPLG